MRRFLAVVPFALSASALLHAACGGDDTQNIVYQSYDSSFADVASNDDAVAPSDAGADAAVTCGPSGTLPTVSPSAQSVWLSQADRVALGLRVGPDSLIAPVTDSTGAHYVFFSGTPQSAPSGSGGFTLRFAIDGDGGLAPDPTAADGGPLAVMGDGVVGDVTPGIPGDGGFHGGYGGYDLDYAGGGTPYVCASGRIVYAFHAENHTDPANGVRYVGSTQGWTGLGQAHWDDASKRLVKEQQIIGLHISNAWTNASDASTTEQTPPASGSGNMVYDADDDSLYLYYNDRTDDPAYAAGDFDCATESCVAVARAKASDVCSGVTNPWKKYYNGDFTEPGVYDATNATEAYPLGTGGKFTPLFKGAGPTPEVVRVPGAWIMVHRFGAGGIALRSSLDGIAWSTPTQIVTADDGGFSTLYPSLLTDSLGASPCGPWVVTFTEWANVANVWSNASVRKQMLSVTW
jgi:hypothetical protein